MINGDTEKMDHNESFTPAEHRRTKKAAVIMNQEMYDLEFEYETVCINFCFKTIGLQECMEVLGIEIRLQE